MVLIYERVDSSLEYKLYISGFSPKQGTKRGGTKVYFEGEGFATNCSLNIVKFGKVSCEIDSCTSTSLTCITKNAYDVYEIDNTGTDPCKSAC